MLLVKSEHQTEHLRPKHETTSESPCRRSQCRCGQSFSDVEACLVHGRALFGLTFSADNRVFFNKKLPSLYLKGQIINSASHI